MAFAKSCHLTHLEYTVKGTDTLERIAAMYNCTPSELVKLNKLVSRMVFPGQKLYVPDLYNENDLLHLNDDIMKSKENKDPEVEPLRPSSLELQSSRISPEQETVSGAKKRTHKLSPDSRQSSYKTPEEELDAECLQRFVKLSVKYFTDGEGTVNGTLLVTPNCIMFDPDLSHPLVKENGSERYCMIAKMSHLISAALYKDISAMTHDKPVTQDDVFYATDKLEPTGGTWDSGQTGQEASKIESVRYSLPPILDSPPEPNEPPLIDFVEVLGKESSPFPLPSASASLGYATSTPNPTFAESCSTTPPTAIHGPGLAVRKVPKLECEAGEGGGKLLSTNMDAGAKKRHVSDSELIEENTEGGSTHSEDFHRSCQHLAVGPPLDAAPENVWLSCPSSLERSGSSEENLESQKKMEQELESFGRQRSASCRKREASESEMKERKVSIGDRFTKLRASVKEKHDKQSMRLNRMRKTFQKSLSVSAQNVGGALTSSAVSVGGVITTSVQAFEKGVQNVGGELSSGAHSMKGAITSMPKNIAQVPRNIVNTATGLFTLEGDIEGVLDMREGWFAADSHPVADQKVRVRKEIEVRKQKSLAKLQELKEKSLQAREQASFHFTCATSMEEKPGLFTPIDEIVSKFRQQAPPTTEMPYFLRLHFDAKKRQRSRDKDVLIVPCSDPTKDEFWFTVAKERADSVYMFFIQWTPEKYGSDDTDDDNNGGPIEHVEGQGEKTSHEGFVLIDSEEIDDNLTRRLSSGLVTRITSCYEKHSEEAQEAVANGKVDRDVFDKETVGSFGAGPGSLSSLKPGSFLNREWEIVTVEEVRRRLSLQELIDISKFPLPDGATDSKILSEDQIRSLIRILPARAEGYPWLPIFSTHEHGFSLHTMYRNMSSWGEDMSPTLLVVKDTNQHIFGAILNCPLTPSDHFYGTGESLLFTFYPDFQEWRWSGNNTYFIKSNKDFIGIGSGKGKFGLWLDEDLYHGRTQFCDTFENQPLAPTEDFIIAAVEAWGFSMGL